MKATRLALAPTPPPVSICLEMSVYEAVVFRRALGNLRADVPESLEVRNIIASAFHTLGNALTVEDKGSVPG